MWWPNGGCDKRQGNRLPYLPGHENTQKIMRKVVSTA
jgi:hypothetical protein